MSETNPAPYYDDEISISELLMKLWAKRGIIVMLPLVLAGLTLVALLMGKTTAGNTVSFYIELNGITLTTDQRYPVSGNSTGNSTGTGTGTGSGSGSGSDIATGAIMNDMPRPAATVATRYPNGTLFSPQDLVNASVLRALAEQYDVSSENLAKHIDVQFGTPISNGVLAEYKAALAANSKGSAQDLAALNARYEDKLSAATKRGLKITVDFVGLEISRKQGSEIAASLPQQWNRVYTQQFNTTLPAEISNLRWTDSLFDLSSTLGLQEADIQLRMLKKGTQMLSEDSRLRGLKNDRETSASDLSGYIDDFIAIFFEPLYLGAFETSSSLSRVYERDIRRKIAELDEEITEVNARLSDIRKFQAGGRAGSESARASVGAQLDGSALTAVVNLAEQAALSSYLQESLEMRFELTHERVGLKTRLARLASGEGESDAAVSMDFRKLANTRYINIVNGYSDLLMTAQTMLQNATPAYYAVITQPDTDGKLIETRDLLFLALALALGGMLAIIAALVWPQKQ